VDRIDALRLLLEVSATGSFSGVARQRNVATSTVTLAVDQLEQEFGVTLLKRSTRRLALTHEGEQLILDARRIVGEWDSLLAGLKEDGPLSGAIRLSATNDFGRTQLRPLLDAFQARHPGLRLTLLLSDSTADLIHENIDLALRSGPLPDSDLHARLLVRGERLVCAAPAYWARAGTPLHPQELTQHNCLVLARPDAPLAAWHFIEDGKPFSVKVTGDRESGDGQVLREWALAGQGVTFKNRWDVQADLDAGRLVRALADFSSGPVDLYAVYPVSTPTRRVAALVDYLAAALAE
jgi:DNA-binding transcriptional LysR family regulator